MFMKKRLFRSKFLEKHVGRERFDKTMQTYFKEWQFKHPQPEDFTILSQQQSH